MVKAGETERYSDQDRLEYYASRYMKSKSESRLEGGGITESLEAYASTYQSSNVHSCVLGEKITKCMRS